MDLQVKVLGLDVCMACVAGKLMHLQHKEECGQASKSLEHVHINIVVLGLLHQLVVRHTCLEWCG